MSYAEQKEREKLVRKARKKVEEAEAEIAAIESQIKALEERFAAGESGDDLYKEHAALTKKLENAMSLWELAVMEADSL